MTYRHEFEKVGLPINEESKKGRKRMATPEAGEERARETRRRRKFCFGQIVLITQRTTPFYFVFSKIIIIIIINNIFEKYYFCFYTIKFGQF